ncbi:40S ribosomal protein, partial [Datura stramonium]|nr:40S ribosomal protein [Datura stramonium]
EVIWGNKIGKPHTVPCKVTGKCGYVTVRMVLAPRVVGIVAARVPKKVLQFAVLALSMVALLNSSKDSCFAFRVGGCNHNL